MPGGDEDPPTGTGRDGEVTGQDEAEAPSGLGRGLAGIIPTLADLDPPTTRPKRRRRRTQAEALLGAVAGVAAEAEPDAVEAVAPAPDPVHHPTPSAVRDLRDDLVGALLDGLADTMDLDLCAYLHAGPGEPPHLFCQAPSLDAVGPARAYDLFDALRRHLEQGRSSPDFTVTGFEGVALTTLGAGSRGLWAIARTGGLTPSEHAVAARFCQSFGRAVHQLDGTDVPAMAMAVPLAVGAHRSRDSVLAEVQLRTGNEIRPGHGRATTRVEAVTRAVLVATGSHVTFRYASEVAHEDEYAAVVLLEGRDSAVSLGSALCPGPGGVATAQATIRALDGLAA